MEDALKQIEHESVQEVEEDEILNFMIDQKREAFTQEEQKKDLMTDNYAPMADISGGMGVGANFIGPNDSISQVNSPAQ